MDGIAGCERARPLDGLEVLLPAFAFVAPHADTLLDNLVDRLKAAAGDFLLDQVLGFRLQLDGHEYRLCVSRMAQIAARGHLLLLCDEAKAMH